MSKIAKGYTLMEVLVILALIAILAVVAAPSFELMIKKNRITSHANQLQSLFKFARSEAAKREKGIDLIAGSDNSWSVQLAETGEVLSFFTPSHESISITSVTTVSISATGSTTAGELLVSDNDEDTDDYTLCIYMSGQSNLITEGVCS